MIWSQSRELECPETLIRIKMIENTLNCNPSKIKVGSLSLIDSTRNENVNTKFFAIV